MGKGVMPFFCIGVISMYTQTERLLLRSPSKKDKDDFFDIVSDRQTCLDDGGYEPYLKKDTKFEKDYDRIVKEVQERIFVELKENNKMIAALHIMHTSKKNCMEIGFCMNKSYRRKGYMEEALHALISLLDKQSDVTTLSASAYSYNLASNNLLKKIGFKEITNRTSTQTHPLLGEITILFYELHLK